MLQPGRAGRRGRPLQLLPQAPSSARLHRRRRRGRGGGEGGRTGGGEADPGVVGLVGLLSMPSMPLGERRLGTELVEELEATAGRRRERVGEDAGRGKWRACSGGTTRRRRRRFPPSREREESVERWCGIFARKTFSFLEIANRSVASRFRRLLVDLWFWEGCFCKTVTNVFCGPSDRRPMAGIVVLFNTVPATVLTVAETVADR